EAVVVRLREEPVRVPVDEGRLLPLVADPHGEDVGTRHARLAGCQPLVPDPREAPLLALVLDAESKAPLGLARPWQREGDPSDVLVRGHYGPAGAHAKLAASFGSPLPVYFATCG